MFLCLQCCCDVRAFTRSTPVCNCEIETRREKARAKEIACAVMLPSASACVPLSVCMSVCTDAMIHSQRSLAVYLLVNCMSVSDMLVSPCTHPAGSCAPFSWVTLAIQMSWISPAPVFARSLRSRWSCDCDRQESEWYNYQRSRFGKGSLSQNQSRGYRELGTGDCEYMCTFMFLCTYLPIHSCDSSCVESSEASFINADHANKQHQSASLVLGSLFLSFFFLLAPLRICRISTHSNSALCGV